MAKKRNRPPASGATAVGPMEAAARIEAEQVREQLAADRPVADGLAGDADPRDYVIVHPEDATTATTPGSLLGLMKAWRRGRATRTVWDALSDGYIALFCVLVFGAMIVNVIIKAQHAASSCTSGECLAGRTILPWVVAAALGATALGLSHLFGPVLASAAEGFWLLDAPLPRRRILAKRLVLAILLALLAGAVVGGLVAVFTGAGVVGIVAWLLACGLGCAGLVAIAAALQGLHRTRPLRWIQSLLWAVAVVALIFVAAVAAGWVRIGTLDAGNVLIPGAIAVVGLVLLVVGAVVATGRLNQLKRTRLVSGGALVSGMQGAAFALDFGLMRDILVEREARERGRVKPTAGKGSGLTALVWRDVQRLGRFPQPLLAIAVSIVIPYALSALGVGVLVPLLSGLALCAVLVPTMGSLRVLTRTPGLARLTPFNKSQLKTASIVVPGVLAALWACAVVPAYMGLGSTTGGRGIIEAAEFAFITGLAGLNGAIRWTDAKQINFETPMFATSMGALPPSMIANMFRGLDMVVLTTALLIFGINPIWSLAIGVVALLFLRSGGFSREELEAMQKENQRELERQKAERQAAKIKVRR